MLVSLINLLKMKQFKFVSLPAFVVILFFAVSPRVVLADEDNSDVGMKKVAVKQVADLIADGREASKKQVPVLIMFSMTHCGYCRQVEEDFLKPMLRNSDYDGKVLIRKIVLDSGRSLVDFKGQLHDAEDVGDEYHVAMVPTLILFDANGKKLSDPIVGLANPYYYGGNLDAAIDSSLQKIRAIAKS